MKNIKQYSEEIKTLIQLEKKLSVSIEKGNPIQVEEIINAIFNMKLKEERNKVEDWRKYAEIFGSTARKAAIKAGIPPVKVIEKSSDFQFGIGELNNIDVIKSTILDFLVEIARQVQNNSFKDCSFLVVSVCNYINENFQSQLNRKEIADYHHVSASHLSRLFKEEMGKTLTEYIQYVRIEAAKQLIINGNILLSDIAHEVGFSDLQYFSRVFKKLEGVSPSKYHGNMQQ